MNRGDIIIKLGAIQWTFIYLYLDELIEAIYYWHCHEWAWEDWADLGNQIDTFSGESASEETKP
jgi:hypothetical protein